MARATVLSNGNMLVCLDETGFVRDLYFPYVGLSNHVSGYKHRIGIMVDKTFSWLDDGQWKIKISYKKETMVSQMIAHNEQLKVSLVTEDLVYNETNVFLRKVDIYNHQEKLVDIKLFFGQEFIIDEGNKRNTGFYDPTHNAIVHYKGRRVFIVNGMTDSGNSIDDYTVGSFQYENREGSYRDAEDGELSKNAVEHGSVDSVIRFCTSCESDRKTSVYYWICAGKTLNEAYTLNSMVLQKQPEAMLHSTEQYWNAWLNKRPLPKGVLSDSKKRLFDTSLFVMRAHVDNRGGIIASADSNMIEFGKDDYSYVWPRDAAFITMTLDQAGYTEVTKPFFLFCKDVLHEDGYLHHRFRPDESLGSTWHSSIAQNDWLKNKILQLPIQEDESAAVIFALWKHYEITKDIEFMEMLFKPLTEKIANFLMSFRDDKLGLPLHSYDLWEEKIGVSTYTCACVYGGLMAAAKFSELLGKRNHLRLYREAANQIKQAAIDHLFSPELNSFVRYAYVQDGKVDRFEVIDASSLFGLWYFDMLSPDDPLFIATEEAVQKRLKNLSPLGGFIRYENDNYFKSTQYSNSWFIITMWEAQRVLHRPVLSDQDIEYVKSVLNWVEKYQSPSGVLAEQIDPITGAPLSATPLVWSHSVYVETVLMYIKKLKEVGLLDEQTNELQYAQ
ncbi:MAG: glycoside hydrolase family 15 protein [Patescibacteria group bacterium]